MPLAVAASVCQCHRDLNPIRFSTSSGVLRHHAECTKCGRVAGETTRERLEHLLLRPIGA